MDNSLFSVKDKVIVITGASSGLGCHFAKTLAQAGAKVAMGARRLEKLKDIVNGITEEGGITVSFALDVTQASSANIRANAIAPGIYRTEINDDLFDTDLSRMLETKIPLSRFGQLDDLNGALFLLCSDASRYITGTIIRVDGGLGINKLQF